MKPLVNIGLVGGVLAFTKDNIEHLSSQAILNDACPSDAVLVNGACQLTASYNAPSVLTFQGNISQTEHSLAEARSIAAQDPDLPWTFWPDCFSTENDDKDAEETYCVFSHQGFAAGRGVFIVTTRTFAYAMLEKPAFTNPRVLDKINQYDSPPFVQHEFPGKGRGLVANKTLHRGEKIFSSTPIAITDVDAYDMVESERLALLHRGVESLPTETQRLFWELMGHKKGDPVEDRINTNNFDVTIDGVSQQVLFPEIAMLNHDCRPNAAYFFDEQTMTQYVHAIRDIQPGEEITITYIDNEKDRKTRLARLQNWGFQCNCLSCTAHSSLTEESDRRLYQITDLALMLDDWTSSSSASPAVAEMLVSLYVQERLDASLGTAYKYAAETYSSFGKKWEAMKYARLSVEVNMLDKGFRDSDVAEMKKMAVDPEKTWSWNKRIGLAARGCGCGHAH